MGASLIIAGRLGDIFGRRRMFLTAMTAFAFTSLLCAAAPTIGVLIAGRFLQGAAGALLLPQGFAMLRQVFAADELGKAMARSEEHTSELQSLMRISYAVFCLQKKTKRL